MKWEYTKTSDEQRLVALGLEGWELCAAVMVRERRADSRWSMDEVLMFYLKRPSE